VAHALRISVAATTIAAARIDLLNRRCTTAPSGRTLAEV
jgi:hypothetical protein